MPPFIDTLRNYDRAWLTPDILAAITVWAIVVPESMAYASIAGMPPETGLYASSIPLIVYAFFASSRRVTFGPSAAIAAISAGTVLPILGANADSDSVFALTLALSIVTGLVLVIAGFARLGVIADFLSTPVLKGFLTGVGLTVALGQVHKILAVEIEAEGFFEELFALIGALPDTHLPTLAMGLGALVLLFGLEKVFPRVPVALVAVIGSILAVGLFSLEEEGIEIVGDIASGLPAFVVPDVGFADISLLVGGAIGLAVVIFGQSVALGKAFAIPHHEAVDANQEMKAIGAANIAGGFFGAFATSGSDSRTAAANASGQQTQLATVLVGVMVLLTAAFLTGLFHDLPEAVLGAIVIHAASGLIKVSPFRKLFAQNRADFWAALATLAGVLVFEVLAGLLIGVFVSLGLLMARAVRPRVVELGLDPATGGYRGLDTDDPAVEPLAGVRIVRFDADLFFANVGRLDEALASFISDDPPRAVIVDMSAVDDVDTTAAEALQVSIETLNGAGIDLAFARLHRQVREQLDRSGLNLEGRVYPRVSDAVASLAAGD